jgi:hypothetical protein
MKPWLKWGLRIGIVVLIAGTAGVIYVFNKPHRDVTTEKGVQLTATALYEAYKKDDKAADAQYLNKAIELSGEVADISTNQEGKKVVNVKTADPMVMINCTFKTDPGNIQAGQKIIFKGICTGYIPDMNVVINEGVLIP